MVLTAFRIAMISTPTSPKTANHMFAIPRAPSTRIRAFTPSAKTTFSFPMRIVKENVVFALGVKALILVLGALGIANMWFAVFGDVGVLIIAILNAVRAMRVRK